MELAVNYFSESIIGGLTREAESIRARSKHLKKSIQTTQDSFLIMRLKKELGFLHKRKKEVINSAITLKNNEQGNSLSLDFLFEIVHRL